MENQVLVIQTINNIVLISQLQEIFTDLGEPDCKLINPYIIDPETKNITPWLGEYTDKTEEIMISSDKILTLVEPNTNLLDNYLEKIA